MSPALVTRTSTSGKILYLDAYDSFSNNIVALVEQSTGAKVIVIRIDDPRFVHDPEKFYSYLKNFDAVIAGPGPGNPSNPEDVGLIKFLWSLETSDSLPVLGICLGFQSLAIHHGASIDRLVQPRHGLIAEILHKDRSIFRGVDEVLATQYHSLQANIGHPIQTSRAVRYPGQLWEPTTQCPELEPLAWDFDSKENGAVLMGLRHVKKPFWGVQFHPESICTNEEGTKIIENWWEDAQIWTQERAISTCKEEVVTPGSPMTMRRFDALLSMTDLNEISSRKSSIAYEQSENFHHSPSTFALCIAHGDKGYRPEGSTASLPNLPPDMVHCATTGSGRLRVSHICELLGIPENEAIVLESGLQEDLLPLKVGTGRYSIIGLVISGETLRLHYYADTRMLQLRDGNDKVHLETEVDDVWTFIREIMGYLKPLAQPAGPSFAPFWGGLMGYVSYEAGLETIDVSPSSSPKSASPDVCFAYITRSIVFDHKNKKIFIQSIRGHDDKPWVESTKVRIWDRAGEISEVERSPTPPNPENLMRKDMMLGYYLSGCTPLVRSSKEYQAAVSACQDEIKAGNSYELCLTAQNEIRAIKPPGLTSQEENELSWLLYQRLQSLNPAPFSAYLRLHDKHILSSSPERYISWTRTGISECRPIKGTVRKTPDLTYAEALAILSSPKERAENLMIVDLTRHQLHGVYAPGNVHVTQLMEIEEYETLFQLVSVVEGVPPGVKKAKSPEEWEDPIDYITPNVSKTSTENLGLEAFISSLPPGSMTGAPKKRSCEILKNVEGDQRRGIYSGVIGYLDVGGGGDFSVVIRTAVKTEGETEIVTTAAGETQEHETWRIGAGGAVTAQSTPEGEYAEMVSKLDSTAAAFKGNQYGPSKVEDAGKKLLKAVMQDTSIRMQEGETMEVELLEGLLREALAESE